MGKPIQETLTGSNSTSELPKLDSQGYVNVSIRGSWTGTINLERAFGNWRKGEAEEWATVSDGSFTANAEKINFEPESGARYRLTSDSVTGTAYVRLGSSSRAY